MAFLRIKKPQPAYLSRIIRDKKKQRQKYVDLEDVMVRWHLPLAEAEDAWDRRVRGLFRTEYPPKADLFPTLAPEHYDDDDDIPNAADGDHGTGKQTAYTPFIRTALSQLKHTRHQMMQRDRAWAKRLWNIVQEERKLKWEEEGVLHPTRGRSMERKQIMARERRERRERNRAAKEAQEEEARRKKQARAERKARLGRTDIGQQDEVNRGAFVVRFEDGDSSSEGKKEK